VTVISAIKLTKELERLCRQATTEEITLCPKRISQFYSQFLHLPKTQTFEWSYPENFEKKLIASSTSSAFMRTVWTDMIQNLDRFILLSNWKAGDFLTQAIRALNHGSILSSVVICRSLYETAIHFYNFTDDVCRRIDPAGRALSNGKMVSFNEELEVLSLKGLHGSRNDENLDPRLKPTNIMTLIQKVDRRLGKRAGDKDYSFYTDFYEKLCALVHPSAEGFEHFMFQRMPNNEFGNPVYQYDLIRDGYGKSKSVDLALEAISLAIFAINENNDRFQESRSKLMSALSSLDSKST
jgi:hypothetical protein